MRSSLKILVAAVIIAGWVGAYLGLNGKNEPFRPHTNNEFARATVAITSLDGRSGGSGVVLKSGPKESLILTNKHVCQLIQVGGLVKTDTVTYPVEQYKIYTKHDLCMIQVSKDLHVTVKVSEEAPKTYSSVIISGHPSLLPTIVTKGHISSSMDINLLVGIKPCNGSEKGQEKIVCILMGGKPITKKFETVPTSALIMPGSSGSGVFNEKGELIGLVFAGGQGLSYGFLVPYSYLKDFVNNNRLYVNAIPDPDAPPKNFLTILNKFQVICKHVMGNNGMCSSIQTPGVYHE